MAMRKAVREELYKGWRLRAFWSKPSNPDDPLVYGYLAEEGTDSAIEGIGFKNSTEAHSHGRMAIDAFSDIAIPPKGRYRLKLT
jgi:hypothetical protein